METQPFQRVSDIKALLGSEWNRLVAEVERLMRIRGNSPLSVTIDATGYHLTWDGRPAELLRVQSESAVSVAAGKRYPAKILRYLQASQALEEYLDAWLLAPNDEQLKAGVEHVGAYVGDHSDGFPVYAMDCCVGPGPASCADCTEVPDTWTITLTDFASGSGHCDLFNGDWTLTAAGECLWQATGANGQTITLEHVDNAWRLTLEYPGVLELHYSGGTDDCCAEQTLGFDDVGTGTCDTHPDEVLAVPDCQGGCGECDGATPDSWIMTAAGFTNGKSCTCTPLNGDYDFQRDDASDCTWTATITGVTATLTKNASAPWWTLTLDLGGGCAVTYNGGTDDCCAVQTLDDADVADCGTPPATLTLTPSCEPEPPPQCSPVCWVDQYVDIRCIAGCFVRTVYQRNVCMNIVNGCLVRSEESWQEVSTTSQGVCDPSDPCEPDDDIIPPPEDTIIPQSCCPFGVPAVLSGTIQGVACTFTYDGTYWVGSAVVAMACGNRTVGARFRCVETSLGVFNWQGNVNCDGGAYTAGRNGLGSCSPFDFTFAGQPNQCGPPCQPPASLTFEAFE